MYPFNLTYCKDHFLIFNIQLNLYTINYIFQNYYIYYYLNNIFLNKIWV